jgi:hypothetical protein
VMLRPTSCGIRCASERKSGRRKNQKKTKKMERERERETRPVDDVAQRVGEAHSLHASAR